MTEADIRSQSFSLTKADYIAYYVSTYFRAYTTFPMAIWMWLVVLASWSALIIGELIDAHYIAAALIALGVAFGWFAVIPALGLLNFLRTLSRTHNAYLGRVAIVSQANFTVEGQGFRDHRSWSQFRKVIVTGRFVLLSLSSSTGIIIPNTAFATRSERDAFVATCRRYVAGSSHREAGVFDPPIPPQPLPEGGLETQPFKLGFLLFSALMLLPILRAFTRPTTGLIAAGGLAFAVWSNRVSVALGDFSSLLITFAGAGLWLLFFVPFIITLNWLLVRGKPMIRNPRRVTISPDNIRVHGDGFDITTNWLSVRRVNRRFGAIQFWTTPAASIAIPISAFPSSEAAQTFQHQAAAWCKSARKNDK